MSAHALEGSLLVTVSGTYESSLRVQGENAAMAQSRKKDRQTGQIRRFENVRKHLLQDTLIPKKYQSLFTFRRLRQFAIASST